MHLKKPKFWDYKEPNIYSYILWPLSILIKIINSFKTRQKVKNYKIKTITIETRIKDESATTKYLLIK